MRRSLECAVGFPPSPALSVAETALVLGCEQNTRPRRASWDGNCGGRSCCVLDETDLEWTETTVSLQRAAASGLPRLPVCVDGVLALCRFSQGLGRNKGENRNLSLSSPPPPVVLSRANLALSLSRSVYPSTGTACPTYHPQE